MRTTQRAKRGAVFLTNFYELLVFRVFLFSRQKKERFLFPRRTKKSIIVKLFYKDEHACNIKKREESDEFLSRDDEHRSDVVRESWQRQRASFREERDEEFLERKFRLRVPPP